MAYKEKIDALDLVIQTLRDHEKKLDDLVTRLERILIVAKGPDRGLENMRRYYEEVGM